MTERKNGRTDLNISGEKYNVLLAFGSTKYDIVKSSIEAFDFRQASYGRIWRFVHKNRKTNE